MINIKFPKYVEIQTNNRCNGYCTICPYETTQALKTRQEMKFDLIKSIIDQCAKNKECLDRIIPYVNNEPFIDKRMIDILRYIKSKGIKVELSTNASLLTKNISDIIIKENLIHDFRISVFSSNKQEYAKIMTGLSFNTVYENITYFLEENKKQNNIISTKII
jgi:MoaA/NifB/PqqE/SkfB family radical SAM enzyme